MRKMQKKSLKSSERGEKIDTQIDIHNFRHFDLYFFRLSNFYKQFLSLK